MMERPKLGETDEDILKLQKIFLENNTKPSVTVIKNENSENNDDTKLFIEDRIENTFEAIPKNANVGLVIERKDFKQFDTVFKMSSRGFPQAKRRDLKVSGKKGSIFAQQIKKLKIDDNLSEEVQRSNTELMEGNFNFPTQSCIVLGKDKDVVHRENINLLKNMKEEDILQERKNLLDNMDPAIIAFLRDKRKNYKEVDVGKPSIAQQNKPKDMNIDELMTPHTILSQSNSEKWLNFDVVEISKLAWMKDIKMDSKKKIKDSQFEARFDFDGFLLPYNDTEINERNRILYHHGEEPERPGYSLQELFQLCRSSILQQKIMALNAIANILSLESTGVYEGVIELPIEQIFFVLRFCIDDNTPSVLYASLKALRNLFCNHIDEACIDKLQGFNVGVIQPIVAVNSNDNEDDETVNDQQLAETDLVKCLSRTNILTRIRYIMNTVKPNPEVIVYCLEILIRLARDSKYVVMQVCNSKDLLDVVIKNFLSPHFGSELNRNIAYGYPLSAAIKFIKVMCSRDKDVALTLTNKYKVMDSIITYLSNDLVSMNADGLKLQIESMHLWITLLNYGLSKEYFSVLQPILLRLLHYHVYNTNVDASLVLQAHVSSLLNLLCHCNNIEPFLDIILKVAIPKWTTQFCNIQEFNCGKLQIISGLLHLLSNFSSSIQLTQTQDIIKSLLKSDGFLHITKNIRSGSNLLSEFQTYKSSSNLIRVEAATWNSAEHIIPILQSHSCLLFLCSLTEYVVSCDDISIKEIFLKHINIVTYLNCIRECPNYGMTTNWFTRIESMLLMNVLKIVVQLLGIMDLSYLYELAVKCMGIFTTEQKRDIELVMQKIIFNPVIYPTEILFRNLNIVDQDNLSTIVANLSDICDMYCKILNLKNDTFESNRTLSIDIKLSNVIPIDWIYSPIILLYSEQQKDDDERNVNENEQIRLITNCLRWIYIYEMYFPELVSMINPTDRFCRLACIFLGSDSLFLNDDIQYWLSLCLKALLKYESNLNFDGKIQGLNSFQDFYIQLLEQYQGVSYGNYVFGNFILIPLAQRHNVKWKKILYSEYAGVAQIFNVTKEQALLDYNKFIEPVEMDESLINSYKRIIQTSSIRKGSILYDIIIYHLNNHRGR